MQYEIPHWITFLWDEMTHPWNGWDDTHIKCLLANTTHRSKHELLQYHHQPIIELEWQQPLQQPRKRSSALWRLLVVRKNKVLVMKKSQHAYELKVLSSVDPQGSPVRASLQLVCTLHLLLKTSGRCTTYLGTGRLRGQYRHKQPSRCKCHHHCIPVHLGKFPRNQHLPPVVGQ